MGVVGQKIDTAHQLTTPDGITPVGGAVAGDFAATLLFKAAAAANYVTASETPSFLGGAANGTYGFSFIPVNVGQYVLQIKSSYVGADNSFHSYTYDVVTQGSAFAASFDDAFCSQGDIERQTGLTFSATSRPNTTQVAAMARLRASEIRAICASYGLTITPDGGSNPVDTTSNNGLVLRDQLRLCNSLGSGMDAVDSAYDGVAPSRSDKAKELEAQYKASLTAFEAMLQAVYPNRLYSSPTISQEIEEWTVDPGTKAPGLPVTMTDVM